MMMVLSLSCSWDTSMEGMVPDMALGRPTAGRSVVIFDLY